MSDTFFNSIQGQGAPKWRRVEFDYTAFSTPALTNTLTLYNLLAGESVENLFIRPTVVFTGTATYTISTGITSNHTKYNTAFNVQQAITVGLHSDLPSNRRDVESFTGTAFLTITATSTGQNLDQATAGHIIIWIQTSLLP